MTTMDALNKLCKWRSLFAGWQRGTRPDTDGETRAVRDHREVTILLRTEMSALTGLLIRKGVISAEKFSQALAEEAAQLDADYEQRFPGFSTSLAGLHMKLPEAQETMRRLGFPS